MRQYHNTRQETPQLDRHGHMDTESTSKDAQPVNRTKTYPRRPHQNTRIPVPVTAVPFEVIAMDLITQLPPSNGYDAILTIVDHGCTRAALFLLCKTTITGAEIASLYFDNVYRWFGLPKRIISDRDPRFTSSFATELVKAIQATRNLSTAYHPQTDRLTERKEPMDRTIPTTIRGKHTRRLGQMAHNRHSRPQQLAECHNQSSTIASYARLPP
jgi:hypothetical protein